MARQWTPLHTFGAIALVALGSTALEHGQASHLVAASSPTTASSPTAASDFKPALTGSVRCGLRVPPSERSTANVQTFLPPPPPPLPSPAPKPRAEMLAYRSVISQSLADLEAMGLASAEQSFVAIAPDGRTTVAHNGSLALPEAAAVDLASTLAHLQMWSPQHQFVTRAFTTGTIRDGVLYGDLWIRSSAPTDLIWEDSNELAARLQERGIHTITGNVTALGRPEVAFDRLSLQPFAEIEIRGIVRVSPSVPSNARLLFGYSTQPLLDGLKARHAFGRNAAAEILAAASRDRRTFATDERIGHASSNSLDLSVPRSGALASVRAAGSTAPFSASATAALLHQIRQKGTEQQFELADVLPAVGRDVDTLGDRDLPAGSVMHSETTSGAEILAGALPDGTIFVAVNRGHDSAAMRAAQDRFVRELASLSQ